MATTRFPRICDVVHDLKAVRDSMESKQTDLDIRLQVYPTSSWAIRVGASDFDQDHFGYWGASSIDQKMSVKTLTSIARDILDQAKEAYSCR
jgi:hypothetical protein